MFNRAVALVDRRELALIVALSHANPLSRPWLVRLPRQGFLNGLNGDLVDLRAGQLRAFAVAVEDDVEQAVDPIHGVSPFLGRSPYDR